MAQKRSTRVRKTNVRLPSLTADPISCAIIFACHPDDAELGMGGTIAALIESGVRVIIADLTDGEPTPHGSKSIRARESAAASNALGVTERFIVGLTNREIVDSIQNRKLVAAVIRKYKPDVIFSHFWIDAHPDHTAASALVDSARFYAKFVKSDLPFAPHIVRKTIYYHAMHLRAVITPSFIFDVASTYRKKRLALQAYRSQFAANKNNNDLVDHVENSDKNWGRLIGASHGEPFTVRELVRLRTSGALLDV